MQDFYAKGGFVFSHRNMGFRAEIPERPATPSLDDENIVALADVPFADVLAYDRTCFPATRAAFLRGRIRQPDALALGCRRDGTLIGYGLVRRCGQGCKIGPLFVEHGSTYDVLTHPWHPCTRGLPTRCPHATPAARRSGRFRG